MRQLATAVAALALMAGAAYAQGNGKGNDRGGGQGGDRAAGASMQGGGNAMADQGKPDRGSSRADRGNGNADRGNADRGRDMAAASSRQSGGDKGRDNARSEARGPDGNGPERGNDRARAAADRAPGNAGRGNDSRLVVLDERGRDRDVVRVSGLAAIPARGLVTGCPPGLAKKNPPCVPPGQVRSPFRGLDRPDFWGLRLDGGRYRYDDGYLVRLGADGRIGGYIPLLGGALAVGNAWPAYYDPIALPPYYESYYGLGPYDSYRYADDVIYRIDPETAAITSIAALLTGDDFTVGSPMPMGYDVYNVPYAYRDQYYDRPDALYRYSDGYVYQVDPETRLIAAAIELLAS